MSEVIKTLEQEIEFWDGMIARFEDDTSADLISSMQEAKLFAEHKLAQIMDSGY